MVSVSMSIVTPSTGIVFAMTVTSHVAVFPPSFVLTVIVAVPGATAVTLPSASTVATPLLDDDQLTEELVASEGLTMSVSCDVSPSVSNNEEFDRDTSVTGIAFIKTVTLQVAIIPPSSVITEIMALPAPIASTIPLITIATFALFVVHAILLLSAL